MEKYNTQRIYKIIMLVIITVIITSLVTAFATYQYMSTKGSMASKSSNTIGSLEYTLSNFRSQLEREYIGEINDEELINGAIKGYIAGLGDPYTEYYTKEEMEDIMSETTGNYIGIGIYMTVDLERNAIIILKPIEGSPAEEIGLQPGDIITKVNGEEYTGEQMEEASNKIKGEEGTKVTLEILRDRETKTVEILRRKILMTHTEAKVLENNIGYISISDFEGGTADEFKTKYEELKKKGITKLIIDIRNNGGGVVDESINVLDMITEKDSTLLITADKNQKEEIIKSKHAPTIQIPIVLLMNEYSASASEIMAGALKDNKKATLVGTKTYGKGIIQSLYQLSDGSGLKITTNEYFTPNRNSIHKIGIEPDIEVKLPEDEKTQTQDTEKEDTQLQKAIEILKETK